MTPPRKDETERRHWRAFWDEVPNWAKAAIVALGSWAASQQFAGRPAQADEGVRVLTEQVRNLELYRVKSETTLDAMRQQLDRIERKLDRGRASVRVSTNEG